MLIVDFRNSMEVPKMFGYGSCLCVCVCVCYAATWIHANSNMMQMSSVTALVICTWDLTNNRYCELYNDRTTTYQLTKLVRSTHASVDTVLSIFGEKKLHSVHMQWNRDLGVSLKVYYV